MKVRWTKVLRALFHGVGDRGDPQMVVLRRLSKLTLPPASRSLSLNYHRNRLKSRMSPFHFASPIHYFCEAFK
jgi:hypothetical protein